MKILIQGINYTPELTGIGKYTGEMASWLANRGHEVRVVTAPPYYPAWKVSPGYSPWRYRHEAPAGNAEVWRCPVWVPSRPSAAKRLLHLGSFALSSLPVMLRQAFWRPHVVLVIEPPLVCAPFALLAARLARARAWLHIQDFEIDAACELGMISSNRLCATAVTMERWLMNRFERVSTISTEMLQRLAAKKVAEPKRVLFPNWIDTDAIYPLRGPIALRAELGLPPRTAIALYAGNMGRKQGLEVLIDAARRLADHPDLVFLLCGDGAVRAQLQELGAGLPNLGFIPLQPAERLNELLSLATLHLLPQRADAAGLVMPSKLLGMFASGRPVVATAGGGTELAQVVRNGGLVVQPGDTAALAEAIAGLIAGPEEAARLGAAGRRYAVQHWGLDAVLGRFEDVLLGG